MEQETEILRLYTSAMLAELIQAPVALVRRWHRKGLLQAARQVQRLSYFDYDQVATARCLVKLHRAGCSDRVIQRKAEELARAFPDVRLPLAELSLSIEGKQILVRRRDNLSETSGQLRLDFDADQSPPTVGAIHAFSWSSRRTVAPSPPGDSNPTDADDDDLSANYLDAARELVSLAGDLEETGRLSDAADCYRASLAASGPTTEANFLLADVLYRLGDLSAARERYYMAIELDEDHVEARANLGCVLAELGQFDLALAAFYGALDHHQEYPDVHFHLARTLSDVDRLDEAADHWRAFLSLAPESPWADEARQRLADRR
jgi:tetratricopeptide (TPR) repeat protein